MSRPRQAFAPLLAILLCTAVSPRGAGLDDRDLELPAVPPKQFSYLAGKYRISSTASPNQIEVEKPITLKVRIIGEGPAKYAPQRAKLDIFPEDLDESFYVEHAPQEDLSLPEQKVWEFVYRLRPKRVDVKEVPRLKLVYYSPSARRFQTSYADEIPIKVTTPPDVTPAKLELKVVVAPETFFVLRPVAETLASPEGGERSDVWLLVLLFALPPLGCVGWYLLWQRRHPSDGERRAAAQSRAAKQAILRLGRPRESAGELHSILSEYLRQRLDLAAASPTAAEVGEHLRRRGVNRGLVAEWIALLSACEASRFSFNQEAGEASLDEAVRLIHALEGDPCVAR